MKFAGVATNPAVTTVAAFVRRCTTSGVHEAPRRS